MPKFQTNGKFIKHTIQQRESKKQGHEGEKFWVGDAIIEVDNRRETQDGSTHGNLEQVPFNVFGKTAERIMELTSGTPVSLTFEVGSRSYQDKLYVNVKLTGFKEAEAPEKKEPAQDADIPF